jgi:hemoglobin/transferrin/lactoferrin receptor protein
MKIKLIVFLWAIFSVANAQKIKVSDKTTKIAIVGAEVFNANHSVRVFTDVHGEFELSNFNETDTISIRAVGFSDFTWSYSKLKTLKEVFIDDKTVSYNMVVYSGSKNEQRSVEISNRIILIGQEQLKLQNPQTTADLLASSGEVYVQKSQLGGGSPMIRGFATNRIMIAVDGIRMNNAIFRSGNLQNVISIDPFSVERTEVLFGPGSNLYGSDAIGGVMSFSTIPTQFFKKGTRKINGNFATRYSSANFEKTIHADFNVSLKKWAFVSSFTHSDYDDLVMGDQGPDEYLRPYYVKRVNGKDSVVANSNPKSQIPSGFSQSNFMQKVAYQLDEKSELIYAFHVSQTSNYARYDRLIRPRGTTLRSAEWNYGPQKWMMNQLTLNSRNKKAFYDKVSVNIALQNFEESRIDRDINKSIRNTSMEKVAAYSLNVDMVKKVKKFQLFYGAEWVYNKVNSTAYTTNINTFQEMNAQTRYPDGSEWSSVGLYSNYSIQIKKDLFIAFGARYTQYSLRALFDTTFMKLPVTEAKINKGALTGSVGLKYKLKSNWIIAANISTGFRSPNVDDIGKVFESTPGSVIVPNTNLEAEYAINTDLSFSKSISDWFSIDATGFYTRLNNALVRRAYSLNGQDSILYAGSLSRVEALQNAAYAEVYGVQTGFRINFPAGLSLVSRITLTKGKEELDDGSTAPLRHAAPTFGVTHLNYSTKKMKLDLYSMYNAEVKNDNLAPDEQAKDYLYAKDENGKPYSPKWLTFNFKMMYQLSSYWNVSAGVENIADIRYRPYSSGIVAPGRNFILAVRVTF